MAYEKKVSRAEPGLIVPVVDDSGSMSSNLAGTSDGRYQWVERYVGIILNDLLARSTEVNANGDPVIKPRYHLFTVLYGSSVHVWGEGEMDIEAAVRKYSGSGNSLGLGGNLGGTDAAAGFQRAYDHLETAVSSPRFQNSFPPMLFHLTDGMSHTDPEPIAAQIQGLSTDDGNVLIVNAFIGTQTDLVYKGPDDFPGYVDLQDVGSNPDNIRLFEMSSPMPQCIHDNLVNDGFFPHLRPGSRLFFDVRTREMLKNVIQVVGSLGSRADRQVR